MSKLINNKNINGNFFIENLDEREEEDRIKIYDSDENYLDYLLLDQVDVDNTPIKEQYDGYIEMLEQFKTVKELLDWLVTNYGFIGTLDELKNSEWSDVIGTEYVNRIGDIYIAISD